MSCYNNFLSVLLSHIAPLIYKVNSALWVLVHLSSFTFCLAFSVLIFSFGHHFCPWYCLLYNKNLSTCALQELFPVGFYPSPSLCWWIRWEIVNVNIPKCCPKVFQLSWVTKMVAIASGFLLLILDCNSVLVKWKEKLIFAAINIREFLSSKSSNFMIHITCSIVKGHVWHYCKNREQLCSWTYSFSVPL